MGQFKLEGIDLCSISSEELVKLGKEHIEINPKLGFSYLYHAYLKKNAEAAYYISQCYFTGYGVQQNNLDGCFFEEEAAKMGSLLAQQRLAQRLLSKNDKNSVMLALLWLRKAAEQGDDNIKLNYINFCFDNGYNLEAKKYLDKIAIDECSDELRILKELKDME